MSFTPLDTRSPAARRSRAWIVRILVIAALAISLIATARAVDQAAGSAAEARTAQGQEQDFVPTEKVPADVPVAFPVDI